MLQLERKYLSAQVKVLLYETQFKTVKKIKTI